MFGGILMYILGFPLLLFSQLRTRRDGDERDTSSIPKVLDVTNAKDLKAISQNPKTEKKSELSHDKKFAEAVSLGYFKYIKPDDYDLLVQSMKSFWESKSVINSFEYHNAENQTAREITEGRTFFIDCESLSEGGVESVLIQLLPIFQANGITIEFEQHFSGEKYTITVNRKEYLIHSIADLKIPRISKWALPTERCMEMIDDIFELNNCKERVFTINFAQDDSSFYIATYDLYRFFNQLGKDLPQSTVNCFTSIAKEAQALFDQSNEVLNTARKSVEELGLSYFYDEDTVNKEIITSFIRRDITSATKLSGLQLWKDRRNSIKLFIEQCSDIELQEMSLNRYAVFPGGRPFFKQLLAVIDNSLTEAEELIESTKISEVIHKRRSRQ